MSEISEYIRCRRSDIDSSTVGSAAAPVEAPGDPLAVARRCCVRAAWDMYAVCANCCWRLIALATTARSSFGRDFGVDAPVEAVLAGDPDPSDVRGPLRPGTGGGDTPTPKEMVASLVCGETAPSGARMFRRAAVPPRFPI